MKYLFFLILTLSVSCNLTTPVKDRELRPVSKYVNEIRLKAAKKLRQDYQLIPCGSGAQMMYKVEMIALSFDYCDLVDEVKARELLIAAIRELVQCVNDDERIRSYLGNYPFTAKNVEIAIFIHEKNGSRVPQGELIVLSAIDGILTYRKDGANKTDPYIKVLQETYEEAVARNGESENV